MRSLWVMGWCLLINPSVEARPAVGCLQDQTQGSQTIQVERVLGYLEPDWSPQQVAAELESLRQSNGYQDLCRGKELLVKEASEWSEEARRDPASEQPKKDEEQEFPLEVLGLSAIAGALGGTGKDWVLKLRKKKSTT